MVRRQVGEGRMSKLNVQPPSQETTLSALSAYFPGSLGEKKVEERAYLFSSCLWLKESVPS